MTGLLDVAAMLPMSVELGLNRAVDDIDVPAWGKRIRESDWTRLASESVEVSGYRFDLIDGSAVDAARAIAAWVRERTEPQSTGV